MDIDLNFQILPSIAPLLNILPELWNRSEGQNLFRSSIVSIVSKLVKVIVFPFHVLDFEIRILSIASYGYTNFTRKRRHHKTRTLVLA